jgi:high-affinity nickel-transport protein
MWGLGHSATVLMVGVLIIFLKIAIPVRLGLAMEFGVALVLIALGSRALRDLLRTLLVRSGLRSDGPEPSPALVHSHHHSHRWFIHRHPHFHSHRGDHSRSGAHVDHRIAPNSLEIRRRGLKSFGVGLVHGLAGSAAIALMVLGIIPTPGWAMIYLVVFCAGTIVGMGFITAMIGMPLVWTATRMRHLQQAIATGAGLVSFGFGLFLAWHTGIGGHLFGATPIWTPR